MSDESREETGEKQGFRVVDRRRFEPDGSERATGGSAPSPGDAGRAAGGSDRQAAAGEGFVLSDAPGQAVAPGEETPPPEATISALFLSLHTTTLVHLGEVPDLATGRTTKDLAAARGMIDLLAMLRSKTRGNLDAEEAQLLERILYDLRMRFVETARS